MPPITVDTVKVGSKIKLRNIISDQLSLSTCMSGENFLSQNVDEFSYIEQTQTAVTLAQLAIDGSAGNETYNSAGLNQLFPVSNSVHNELILPETSGFLVTDDKPVNYCSLFFNP